MADIIIAFPKIEDAKNLRRILNKNGHDVTLVCDSGAQIVSAANSLDGGIVICGLSLLGYALFRDLRISP